MADGIATWLENPQINNVVGIFGLVFAIWGIYLAIQSRNRKRLSYSFNGFNLIEDFSEKFEGLEIRFKDEKVKNLAVTRLMIWNSGNITISNSDHISKDRLRIVPKEGVNILDCQVIEKNVKANQFAVSARTIIELIKTKGYLIEFEYFDKGEGCIIQLIHNGKSYRDVQFKGKLLGIQKFHFVKIPINGKEKNDKRFWIFARVLTWGCVGFFAVDMLAIILGLKINSMFHVFAAVSGIAFFLNDRPRRRPRGLYKF